MSFSIPIKKEVKESNSKKNKVITYTLWIPLDIITEHYLPLSITCQN